MVSAICAPLRLDLSPGRRGGFVGLDQRRVAQLVPPIRRQGGIARFFSHCFLLKKRDAAGMLTGPGAPFPYAP
jgi:hypothetical protein